MPSNRPVIAPLAIAYIQAHGPQTNEALSAALGFGPNSVAKSMMNAVDRGQVAIVRREVVGPGSLKHWYGIAEPKTYPRISAGEYVGWMPSGTRPEDCRRVAP